MNLETKDIETDKEFMELYNKCRDLTMTSIERAYSLYKSCVYIIDNKIDGDFVECGVWKGGSSMLIALTLLSRNINDRKIYLYDTFDGMSNPEDIDIDTNNQKASFLLNNNDKSTSLVWSYATENEVKENLFSTNYDISNLIFVKGKVEETIPDIVPEKIALLRVDTDWYSSTIHELNHLYPRLERFGILIIDDYGHWAGARKAVDEYFGKNGKYPMLNRIDYTGRILIKN